MEVLKRYLDNLYEDICKSKFDWGRPDPPVKCNHGIVVRKGIKHNKYNFTFQCLCCGHFWFESV